MNSMFNTHKKFREFGEVKSGDTKSSKFKTGLMCLHGRRKKFNKSSSICNQVSLRCRLIQQCCRGRYCDRGRVLTSAAFCHVGSKTASLLVGL